MKGHNDSPYLRAYTHRVPRVNRYNNRAVLTHSEAEGRAARSRESEYADKRATWHAQPTTRVEGRAERAGHRGVER